LFVLLIVSSLRDGQDARGRSTFVYRRLWRQTRLSFRLEPESAWNPLI